MRPHSTLELSLLGLAMFGIQVFGVACNDSVIQDVKLDKALREQTGRWAGALMPADLAGITELRVVSNSVNSLEGLQHCVNLRELTLTTVIPQIDCGTPVNATPNAIRDLRPLVELVKLESLKMEGNPISDLTPLQGLTGLQTLALDRCEVGSLAPLEGLTNLRYLGLSANRISDITPLAANRGLAQGDALDLTSNPLGGKSTEIIGELKARGVQVVTGGEVLEIPAVI